MYGNDITDNITGHNTMVKRSQKLPMPVRRQLLKLGQDIRNARRRRRIQAQVMAERASISRTTLHKVERGDPGVSLGIYATVLFVLGLSERLADVADVSQDRVGLDLAEEKLPERIRYSGAGTNRDGVS
jgi:transcriptional regulator with XRE-family HTH domain